VKNGYNFSLTRWDEELVGETRKSRSVTKVLKRNIAHVRFIIPQEATHRTSCEMDYQRHRATGTLYALTAARETIIRLSG
jgi:hypothetical protein